MTPLTVHCYSIITMTQHEGDMQEIRKNLKEAAKWLNSAGKRIDSAGQRMDRMSQEIAQREERYAQEQAERAQAQAKQDETWNIKMNELRQEIKEVNQEIQTVNQERKAAHREVSQEIQAINQERKAAHRELNQEIKAVSKEVNQEIQAVNQEIKAVNQMIGGHTQNVGSVTEKHFVNSFEKYPSMGEIHFDLILPSLKIGSRRASHEIDIVMLNGSYCAVVEVKYKCHPHDVTRYRAARGTLLSQLRALFPKEHYIFGLASDEFVEEAKHEALGAGLVVVEREGAELKIDASGMELF